MGKTLKAFILAAGEGRRMRPLTLTRPKPLLEVGEYSLIEHHLLRLRSAGIREIVINVCYLGQQIIDRLGDGSRYGVTIQYSFEETLLETGGAIEKVRDMLGSYPFLLVNSDTWIEIDFARLTSKALDGAMHLVMVRNPEHHSKGDFHLNSLGMIEHCSELNTSVTYSGVSIIDPLKFKLYPNIRQKFPLKEVLDWFIARQAISGELYDGIWVDVGTPERLERLKSLLAS